MDKKTRPNTPSTLDQVTLRPSERVIQYLLQEFDRPELKEGSRLPSNRELALRLQVSVPTIQGVLRQLSREGRVRAQRGSGTYLISRPSSAPKSLKIVIAAPLHPDESRDPWLHAIFAGLMPAVIKSKVPITLCGISPQEFGTDISVQYLLDELPSADGLIVIPFALLPDDRRKVTEAYEQSKKPVVHLHPPEMSATANFVSADYLEAANRLGNAWHHTKRRRIYLLSDDLKYSVGARLRHTGLISGLGTGLGESISFRLIENIPSNMGESQAFLKKLFEETTCLPDAIYAVHDRTALSAIQALQELGHKVPEDVSVAAGTGFDFSEITHPNLTRSQQPLHQIGKLLLEMVCERIEKNGESVPGRFLPAPFVGGGTTRPEENEFLGIVGR